MAIPPLPRDPVPLDPLAVAAWELLPDGNITITATKRDVQELYLCMRDLVDSLANLQQTIIDYSNANLGLANSHLQLSQQQLVDSQSRVNMVMSAVMRSARRAP